MAKTTGATAVAERPTDALWLAALPTPRITGHDRLPARAGEDTPPAEGALSGLPGAVTDMAVTCDGRFLAAAHQGRDAVSIVDLATLTARATVTGITGPHALAATDLVYVGSSTVDEDLVVAIDPAHGSVLAAKEITGAGRGLAAGSADRGDVVVLARDNEGSAELAVVDVESGALTVIGLHPAATADTVRVGADRNRAYAARSTSTGGVLAVVDLRSRRAVQRIALPAPAGDIAVHPDGRRVLLTGWDPELGGVVTVVDAAAGRVVESVALGALPTQVVLTATCAYIAHGEGVIVLALSNSRIVDRIDIGRPVACLAVNSAGSRLYLADYHGTVIARALEAAPTRRAA